MSDLMLNLDMTLHPPVKKATESNVKHQRFFRRRHFLERKGFLKQKQLPAHIALPKQDASEKHVRRNQKRRNKRQKLDRHSPVGQDRKPVPKESSVSGPKTHSKGNSSGGTKNSKPQDSDPPSASGKSGSGSLRHNGPQVTCKGNDVPRVSLLCEYESGLPASLQATKPSKIVAIDCEMVGTGPGGRTSDLARCSVVSYHGDVVYDKYIRPLSPITNYRTRWSGIQRHHMKNAVPFKVAQKEILRILSEKIVIGHAIHNDFKALKYFHPKSLTRDTSKIPLLNRKAGFPENEPASLKRLTKQLLHRDIQVGHNGHSSIEDARATMELYKAKTRRGVWTQESGPFGHIS